MQVKLDTDAELVSNKEMTSFIGNLFHRDIPLEKIPEVPEETLLAGSTIETVEQPEVNEFIASLFRNS